MNIDIDDRKYMREALTLAKSMRGRTAPDPMVGAVIVKDGEVISRGYHAELGSPHAEVYAIEKAAGQARGGTIYVNLEPCCHWGNNPPCTDAIMRAGLKRVVMAMRDPNPLIKACDSIKTLEKAGIEVKVGVLEAEAYRLNEVFIKYITLKQPYVILKMAVTLDGKIATAKGDSRWVTSLDARQYVHRLRSEVAAIIVGINTVLADDPRLTVRDQGAHKHPVKKNPVRVVLDSQARIPLTAKIMNVAEARTIVAVSSEAPADRLQALKDQGVELLFGPTQQSGHLHLPTLLKELAERELSYVMVEGGAEVTSAMLRADLVDKVFCFVAPKILGGRDSLSAVGGPSPDTMAAALNLLEPRIEQVGNDALIRGYLHSPLPDKSAAIEK